MPGLKGPKYVIPLSEISSRDYEKVGHKGVSQSKLFSSRLRSPDSFVITTDAFDDFVIDAEIVQIISETLEEQQDLRDSEKISKKIYANILATSLRLEFLNQINLEYSVLKRHEKEMFLSFYPSFHTQDPELHELLKPREMVLVKSFEKITDVIKEIWTDLFTTELIGRRFNDNFFDLPSIAIVINRELPYESTGRLVFDKKDLSIQAQFGNMDKDFYYADEYLVDLRKSRLFEKKINLQTRMLVRKKNEIVSIPVSKEWQKKQKVSEHILEEIIRDSKKIEKSL